MGWWLGPLTAVVFPVLMIPGFYTLTTTPLSTRACTEGYRNSSHTDQDVDGTPHRNGEGTKLNSLKYGLLQRTKSTQVIERSECLAIGEVRLQSTSVTSNRTDVQWNKDKSYLKRLSSLEVKL